MEATTTIRVRYQETDQMGIVYHTNYIVWFEIGRTEWLRQSGATYKELENLGVLLPVTNVDCKYHASARYDDECIISTTVESFTPARMKFFYQILRKSDGKLLAEGHTEHCFLTKEGKIVRLQKAAPQIAQIIAESSM
ncbi:acyl-CoA thioesterase [Fodinisporobacter ferrooxydans]|uniref:Acyl-CoA thioesterase n=1 Tax=Fodinisporobacter ferrooxydans TaxID=2901836 RepID=A0ABY4CTB1_9BACL|nr:acyl-CoA thioesterase [Alicyclobacillaceae bacterium MYW30-H2]